jgi:hypothetical protein
MQFLICHVDIALCFMRRPYDVAGIVPFPVLCPHCSTHRIKRSVKTDKNSKIFEILFCSGALGGGLAPGARSSGCARPLAGSGLRRVQDFNPFFAFADNTA